MMREEVRTSLISVEPTEEGLVAVFRFREDLPVFAGHFPGRPLVPGVYLIESVRLAAERVLERPLGLDRIADARFTALVAIGRDVRIRVSLAAEDRPDEDAQDRRGWIAKAVLECDGQACAKLRLRLSTPTG